MSWGVVDVAVNIMINIIIGGTVVIVAVPTVASRVVSAARVCGKFVEALVVALSFPVCVQLSSDFAPRGSSMT